MRWAALVLLLVGCAKHAAPAPAPVDDILAEHVRAGQLALRLDRPQEAATQFRQALERAEARDDATAIGDVGFDLVVAELDADQPAQALQDARARQIELSSRGAPIPPALLLAEATALFRTGANADADRIAAIAQGGDPPTSAAASFLRGLIADANADTAGLANATSRLAPDSADGLELQARMALQHGDATSAKALALQAVDLRRTDLDYRGLARGLQLAGTAADRAGDHRAAQQYYLRAEQSRTAQKK